tara:strand:+ start:716 stop:1363 length:648 start_codon:yes stop_codon:yes gene_type:complete
MHSNNGKIIINIDDKKYQNWKACLTKELQKISSNKIEIDCKSLSLNCKDVQSIIEISNKWDCKIISFCSTSAKTIISAQALGYPSQFIAQNYSNEIFKRSGQNSNLSNTLFHQGTVRSGEYINSQGDLLILGDVNPGAIVSAEGNVMIWGKLLGIAHAGSKGNRKATISALQLRPLQLRIANIVARGPQEKPERCIPEQATIDSEKIIISPLDTI